MVGLEAQGNEGEDEDFSRGGSVAQEEVLHSFSSPIPISWSRMGPFGRFACALSSLVRRFGGWALHAELLAGGLMAGTLALCPEIPVWPRDP